MIGADPGELIGVAWASRKGHVDLMGSGQCTPPHRPRVPRHGAEVCNRVTRFLAHSAPLTGLGALAASAHPLVVIGEVAGALQGSPLVLVGAVVEVCAEGPLG